MNELALAELVSTCTDPPARERDAADEDGHVRISTSSVVEMLLKDQGRLNQLLRDEANQRDLIPRFMAVALAGFAIYGVVVTALFNALWIEHGLWISYLPPAHWDDGSVANLTLGYAVGLVAANGICLPSFYFYGLLAGIKITMLGVTSHALKGMAAGAVALVGLLPIYVAVSLTSVVFPFDRGWDVTCIVWGLVLPFAAGTFGAVNLYQGFAGLADTMQAKDRCARECFLRRLILAWVGCASFVTPVVIYSLWDYLGDVTQSFGL